MFARPHDTPESRSDRTEVSLVFELDVIAAVVIGGASHSGGRGAITGTIVGTLLISFLRNGCTLVGISTNTQLIVIGMVIVLAVAIDQFTRRQAGDAG